MATNIAVFSDSYRPLLAVWSGSIDPLQSS